MASPKQSNAKQYYLGIAGNQIGPMSEDDVIRRIQGGSVTPETLIWCEGMEEWGLITSIATFDSALKTANEPPPKTKAEPKKVSENFNEIPKKKPMVEETPSEFFAHETGISISFDEPKAKVPDQKFVSDRMIKIGGGLIALILFVSGYFYYQASRVKSEAQNARNKKSNMGNDSRQITLGKAASELLLDPKSSEQSLMGLIQSNSIDTVAQEAIRVLLDHYQRSKRFGDSGKLMLQVKKYGEAAKYFSMDPFHRVDAQKAFQLAYDHAKDPNDRKKYAIENIRLLLATPEQEQNALEKIRAFEKEFPNEPHPYGYYLKSVEDRIADIFSRISFHFVQSLMGYVEMELPQINLGGRPLVEVKKDKNGNYKITGSYKGEILLNKDQLQNIQFVFWLNGDHWVLVDTNLTKERKKWAAQERAKIQNLGVSGPQMLKNLEGSFKMQFPNAALHEKDLVQGVKVERPRNEF